MTYRANEVARAVGVTYRVLDHWIHKGYVPAETIGRGIPRELTEKQAVRAAMVAAITKVGFPPATAAELADGHRPDGPVTIAVDTAAIETDLLKALHDEGERA